MIDGKATSRRADGSLVKTPGKVGVGGLVKLSGSHTWGATKKWMVRNGWRDFGGQPFHHWLVEQNSAFGKLVPDVLKNQPWNIMRMQSFVAHQIIHAPDTLFVYRLANGTPGWAKGVVTSISGRLAAQFEPGSNDENDDGP
ncbi:MAG: hypothetical protein ACM3PC_04020 [Deltaproteobacteria bacterium]